MSAMRDLSKNFEDKEFVKNYFRGVENGNDVTQRLNRDGATLNSPDLIARLVKWLEEAEPSDESTADAAARAEQEVAAMNLNSKQEEKKETENSGGQDSGETPGGESSDGTTRTSSPITSTSNPKPVTFGSGSESK